jgi:hypothetical protein
MRSRDRRRLNIWKSRRIPKSDQLWKVTAMEAQLNGRKLEEDEWRSTLDRLSKALAGKRAVIEISSTLAEALSLVGITFDPYDDIIDVALDGVDHMIERPREIFLDQRDRQLIAVEVIDINGIRHTIRLKEPVALPTAA